MFNMKKILIIEFIIYYKSKFHMFRENKNKKVDHNGVRVQE